MSGQRQDFCRADSLRIVSFISAQVPFYTIHKILAGLVDACRYSINNLPSTSPSSPFLPDRPEKIVFTSIPWEICLKPLVLLVFLNCMAQKSGTSHPILQRNVKNAQFSRVFKHISHGITVNSFSCFGGKRRIEE